MSGGSWNYVYSTFEEVGDRLCASVQPERRALGRKVKLIATAIHDIEWVDSSDYSPGDEIPAIEKALGKNCKGLVLAECISKSEAMLKELQKAVAEAKELHP